MVFNKVAGMINRTSFMRQRRKKFAKKYPILNTIGSKLAMIPKLTNSVNMIKGIINSERQYSDVTIVSTNVTATGAIAIVNQISQGDDIGNRQGNSILHKYLAGRYSVVQSASAGTSIVRLLWFVDTANQGTTPAVTDVLVSASVNALKKIDNLKRFIVLKDERIVLSSSGTKNVQRKVYLKTDFHCKYSSSAGSDILQNSIFLLYISNEGTNYPVLDLGVRNAFYDN